MSRTTKWKLEKTKVKVVFRLQLHATHIPQTGCDKLFISFIAVDSGKTIAKTTKAIVKNGTCKWADPIYETTSLLLDIKSKLHDDKLYKFVLAMGSSRSSILGEATINLSDYADALKPSAVALPLHGCKPEAVLHVTVQLLTSKTGFREFEQQRDLQEKGLPSSNDLIRHLEPGSSKFLSAEETKSGQVNARGRLKPEPKELPSLQEGSLINEYSDSVPKLDALSNASGSLCAEKQDVSSVQNIENLKIAVSVDISEPHYSRNCQKEKCESSGYQMAQGSNESHSWGSNHSMDDWANVHEENLLLRGNLEIAESSILILKVEVKTLQSHANDIGSEIEKLSHQLTADMTSCQELEKEVALLKSECLKFKGDLEQLKAVKSNPYCNIENSNFEHGHLFEYIQVRLLDGILALEKKIKGLCEETGTNFNDRGMTVLHLEFEDLLSILLGLKQGTGEVMAQLNALSSGKPDEKETREVSLIKGEKAISGKKFVVDLCQPNSMLRFLGPSSFFCREPDSVTAIDAMKGKIFELLQELDVAKVERENLGRKMDQMECYYEALIQELEENQRQILGELQNVKNEHSTCLYAISNSNAEVESIRQDLNQQLVQHIQEKHDLDILNKELERRATTSEAALGRVRLNYSIAVDQLQKDLEILSSQVVSMFETNERLVKQAFSETSPTCFSGYLELMQNDYGLKKLNLFQSESSSMRKQHIGGDILLDDFKKSVYLQKELYQKFEEELHEMYSTNLFLDLFCTAQQQTLSERNANAKFMEQKNEGLEQQLELTIKSNNLLSAELQTATNDIYTLKKEKESCAATCTDIMAQNQILEAKIETVTKENCVLQKQIAELEELLEKCRYYESRYETVCTEKTEAAILLQQETEENKNLKREITSLKTTLKTFQAEVEDSASSKENLQKNILFVQNALVSFLEFYKKQFDGLFSFNKSSYQAMELSDFEAIILQLKEFQHNACQKIHELMEEKKDLEVEKNIAEKSLRTARSEKLRIEQNFKDGMQEMVAKLDVSNDLVEKIRIDLESVANKFQISSNIEENFALQTTDLVAGLDLLELKLQNLTFKGGDLAQEILDMKNLATEFSVSKSTIADLLHDKQSLSISLICKTEEVSELISEINYLKEYIGTLREALHLERSFRDKLEATVADLGAQLNQKNSYLLDFEQKKTELEHYRHRTSDLEKEMSRINHLLSQREDCLNKLQEESSFAAVLESQLLDMHDILIAENVEKTFVQTQYQCLASQLVQQLQFSDFSLKELQKKHLDMGDIFNRHQEVELQYIKENEEWMKKFGLLKSELESFIAQNGILSYSNDALADQVDEYKKKWEAAEAIFSEDRKHYEYEIEHLEHVFASVEKDIDYLLISKEELLVTTVVLKAKLDEQQSCLAMLEECNTELIMLREHCNELNHKLSEQTLKTEEFKNLTIHLNELKDKAESRLALEKRESEGPSVAMQESLRIAFIKEQYETRLQELKQHLSVSKKHGEEMLCKLQDAINEIENRKKLETSHLKKNEELSLKILDLEDELQLLLSDKREKIKAYDRLKAELECALLSLECCKEEKAKLEANFQESEQEKYQITFELASIKEKLENSALLLNVQKNEHCSKNLDHKPNSSDELVTATPVLANSVAGNCSTEMTGDLLGSHSFRNSSETNLNIESLVNVRGEDTNSSVGDEDEMPYATLNDQRLQDTLPRSVSWISDLPVLGEGDVLSIDSKHSASISDDAIVLSVRSSFKRLHEELERMKSENSDVRQDYQLEPNFWALQGELMQLDKANEELQSMYPLFNEVSSGGNALERVLALEIELAEALRAKNRSSIHFQSSFLRQHSDEEAIVKSFRDINELIQDMLDIKGRYAAVETELKEMHDRYSQLSLQFAEVEGERQKLMMTLKNVRMSRKPTHFNRSSSAVLSNQPS